MAEVAFTMNLPVAKDALGRWLDDNGGEISLTCSFGTYTATVSWCRLISASDEHGRHRESWSVSRNYRDPVAAISAAVEEAMRQSK